MVGLFAALAAISLSLVQRIEVTPNLAALLPPGRPELARLEEMGERVPASTPLNILISGATPAATHAARDAVYEAVTAWPDTLDAIKRRDPAYFLERRLLFLPADELALLVEDADAHVSWHECESLPGCVNIDKDAPPLPDMENLQQRFLEQPSVTSLLSLLGLDEVPLPEPEVEAADATLSGETDPNANADAEREPDGWQAGDLCAKEENLCVVTAVLSGSPFDLAYAEQVVHRVQQLEQELRRTHATDQLRVVPDGPYRDAPLVKQATTKDLARVGILAALLVIVLLAVQFRTWRALLLLVAPIATSLLVTVGAVATVHPQVNIISAVTLAVLAGLGVDFGIHLLTHYSALRSGKHAGEDTAVASPPVAAMTTTFQQLKGPLITAGLTTACGFGSLLVAEFRAFSEMGGIASLGILCALLCFFLLFPALTFLVDRRTGHTASMVREWPEPTRAPPRGALTALLIVGLVAACAGGWLAPRVEFEQNFRKLKPAVLGHGMSIGQALHGGTTRSQTVVMADSAAQLQAGLIALEQEGPGELITNTRLPFTLGPSTFIPDDQDGRLEQIAELRDVHARAEKHIPDDQREDFERWSSLLDVSTPIEPTALPKWVRSWLSERDGSFGRLGLLYTELSQAHAGDMAHLATKTAGWEQRFDGVRFASPGLLLGAVLPGLQKDIPRMLAVALLGLIAGTLLASRSLRRTALVLAPIAVASALALGAAYALGLKINLYNILIFPVALGLGIDGAVYISWAMEEVARSGHGSAFSRAARAVLGSTLTTIAGFGAMVISTHPGLASLGYLSILLFCATLFSTLLWLPALLARWPRLSGKQAAS